MHRDEAERYAPCADCGADVLAEVDRVFAFGEGSVLCWKCAIRRGGRYDETHDRWVEDPSISDLASPPR